MRRLLGLTAIGQAAFAAAAAFLLGRAGAPWPWALGAALALATTVAFVRRANVYLRGERRSRLAVALVDVPYFVHWTGSLLAVALLPLAVLVVRSPAAAAIAWAAGIAIAAYGTLVRRRWVATERVSIVLDDLDPSLDGYRIAHLSDLHIGPFTPRAWGMRWARAASALACDLAVVTGDLVTSGSAFHEDVADVVGALRAKDGVLVVMGNHDYSSKPDALVAGLEARGARVLRNDGRALGRLFVAGLDDRWSRRADLDRALRDRPAGASTILLAHDPVDFPAAAARGVDLVLSGHTHGGQIALPLAPRRWNLSRLHRRHTLGLYRDGRSALLVHPGLGTSGPPVRVGVAPAIVEITLLCARAARERAGGRACTASRPGRD